MCRKALIIEDDVYMAANLSELLQLEGFAIQSIREGTQALDYARAFQPDIILSDLRLPGMDGFDILDAIRQDGQTAHIPLVFLTGRSESRQIRMALEHGADGYLVKPFEIPELLDLINRLLASQV